MGGGFIKELKGRYSEPSPPSRNLSPHHAVNTGNKGVRKDTLCFKGLGGHCPLLRVFKSFFSNKLLRILHCLDTVPPLDQVLWVSSALCCGDGEETVLLRSLLLLLSDVVMQSL